ncbi:isochorismate synthase [Terrilactibacillus laevilacticus]|uniref:isochorismate synthase n=1 Tax=Terrilactibacillus laevilacticus TaxID=1380157 RepID=A0ABW5PQL0_9BACI|nr:isochorismate synthase [Terrilactibacillus laevilacticus]
MTKDALLFDLLAKGCLRQEQLKKSILVSYTREFDSFDAIDIFHIGEKWNREQRLFWSDPDGIERVGLGYVLRLTAAGENRVSSIAEQKKKLFNDAIIEKWDQGLSGGPLLFGGFSFDPDNQKTSLKWHSFGDATFVLPEILLTRTKENKSLLTINCLMTKDKKPYEEYKRLYEQIQHLKRPQRKLASLLEEDEWTSTEEHLDEWMISVKKAIDMIQSGTMQKIVLSRTMRVDRKVPYDIEAILKALVEHQASHYVFAFTMGESTFLGASPERLVKKQGTDIRSMCLAGTTTRGKTEEEDKEKAELLLRDQKNLQEHQWVVNMISQVLSSFCQSLVVPQSPSILKAGQVQHLCTPISGKLKEDKTILELVQALHPTPALGGYPQKEALQWIRELEVSDRGWYGSPVGWMDEHDDGEYIVAIRSCLIKNSTALLFAGCGLVSDSTVTEELKETRAKFKPIFSALGGLYD